MRHFPLFCRASHQFSYRELFCGTRPPELDSAGPPVLESLETRRLFAIDANLANGVLTVNGDQETDVITIQQGAANITVQGIAQQFPTVDVNKIVVNGGDEPDLPGQAIGGDKITLSTSVTKDAEVYGGAGRDTIQGGSGGNILDGGAGNDQLKGQVGNSDKSDFMYGGSGTDILDGLDGSDYLMGEAGVDYMYGGDGDDYFHAADLQTDGIDGGNDYDTLLSGDRYLDNIANVEVLPWSSSPFMFDGSPVQTGARPAAQDLWPDAPLF